MSKHYKTNTQVEWPWGQDKAQGYIRNKYTESITKAIKGTKVTRNGTEQDPAYLIEQSDGDLVLKLQSELNKTS